MIKSSNIALLAGIAGAGKDAIRQRLLKLSGYQEVVSHTTRAPRSNAGVMEVDGRDYNFIDLERAAEMLKSQEFIEAKLVHGSIIYGTSVRQVELARASGATAITDVDVQGVAEYKKLSQSIIALFIIPPSHEVWLDRLRKRYASEDEFRTQWPKRQKSAIAELGTALSVPYFHFVLNDDLDRAVRVSDEIVKRGDTYLLQDDEARILARELLAEIKNKA